VTEAAKLPAGPFELQAVELENVRLAAGDLECLAGLERLERLELRGVDATDADLERIARSSKLRTLVLNSTGVTDDGLRHMSAWPQLVTVSLFGGVFTDAAFAHLAKLPALESLNLEATDVTGQGVGQLRAAARLRYLNLGSTNVDDAAADQLAQLSSLGTLLLGNSRMTDAGAAKLVALTGLRQLGLANLPVSSETQAALRQRLPTCKITFSGAAAEPPSPNSPPLPTAVAAPSSVVVQSARGLRPVAAAAAIRTVPAVLEGAVAYVYSPKRHETSPNYGRLTVDVRQDAALFLAVAWDDEKDTGEWKRELLTTTDLWRDGWVAVGRVDFHDPVLGTRYVFWRPCKAGESLTLRTQKYLPPVTFVSDRVDAGLLDRVPDAEMPADVAAYVLRSKTHYWLTQRRFDELDAYVAKLRTEKPRLKSGATLLSQFYLGLTPVAETEDEWQHQQATYEAWLAARPKSLTAHIALSEFWERYAWEARGGGYADTVTSDGWQKFGERLARAREWIAKADKLEERDPYLCRREIHLLIDGGGTPDDVERVVRRSLEIDPDYTATLIDATRYFLPRWHGGPGQLEDFAAHAAELTRDRHGEAVYAEIVARTANYHQSEVFDDFKFSWDRVKQGYADLKRKYPETKQYDRLLAELACFAGDRAAAQAAFANVPETDDGVWSNSDSLKTWRSWAQPEFLLGDQTAVYEGARSLILQIDWTRDGKYWTTLDNAADLITWDAESGELLTRRDTRSKLAQFAALLPSGDRLVAANYDDQVLTYDVDTAQAVTLGAHDDLQSAALSPDGFEWATAGGDKRIKFWNLQTGRPGGVWDLSPDVTTALAYVPGGRTLVTGGRSRRVQFWNRDTEKRIDELPPFKAGVRRLAVSPDGKLLAVLTSSEISLWRVADRTQLVTFPLPEQTVNELIFSPDGTRLAAATGRMRPHGPGDVVLWDATSGKLLRTLRGHKAIVRTLKFSPDGERLASAGDDMTIRVWPAK
jgi:hypothetical protein